ncbi:MAG: hypothetical protein Q7S33_04810 [Nanoarchaeota archaeon]|nr:hypothetical protein [Nanoarchaeota archaeon]
MPYIKQEKRKELDALVDETIAKINALDDKDKDGCINYMFTRILKNTYSQSYFNYNRIMGVLECVKQEFYRRVIGPYEDLKIKENGDVQ